VALAKVPLKIRQNVFDIIDKVVYKLSQFPQNHHHKSTKNLLRILIVGAGRVKDKMKATA